jgi:hypothetical protein
MERNEDLPEKKVSDEFSPERNESVWNREAQGVGELKPLYSLWLWWGDTVQYA